MAKKISENRDPFDEKALNWFDQAYSEMGIYREIWLRDFVDTLALNPDSIKNKDNPLDLLRYNEKENWKEQTNIGALKTRAKAQAIKSNIIQSYKQGNKIPCEFEKTPYTDYQEMLIKSLPEGTDPKEINELVSQSNEQENTGLKMAEKHVMDKLVEADFDGEVLEDIADYYVDYGSCFVHTPVIEKKRVLNHQPVPNVVGNGVNGFSLRPRFINQETLNLKILPPWRGVLDPEANGNAQDGFAAGFVDYINRDTAMELKRRPGFDHEKIQKVLDGIKDKDDNDNLNETDSTAHDTKADRYMGLSGVVTKPIEMISLWVDYSREDLEKWRDKNDKRFPEELYQELIQDEYYADFDDETGEPIMEEVGLDENGQPILMPRIPDEAIFKIQVIYLNRERVYLKPNNEINRGRPLYYEGMMHLKGTNYFFGAYSSARDVNKIINKVTRRAIDNEILSGSSIFAVDPDVIDPDTMTFEPGAVWEADVRALKAKGYGRMVDAVQQFQFNSVSDALLSIGAIADGLLDEITMTPKHLSGVSPNEDQTATEVSINKSSSEIIILNWLKRMDKNLMVPIAQSFYDYMVVHDMLPPKARVSAKIRVFGAETFANQTLNKRRIVELFSLLPQFAQVMPDIVMKINVEDLIIKYFVSLGFNEDEVIRDERAFNLIHTLSQQVQQLQAQIQQIMEQAQQLAKQNQDQANQIQDMKLDNMNLQNQNQAIKAGAAKSAENLNLQHENARLSKQVELLQRQISGASEVAGG